MDHGCINEEGHYLFFVIAFLLQELLDLNGRIGDTSTACYISWIFG